MERRCKLVRRWIRRSVARSSLSLRRAACIFTHSGGPRRNAGRPAPRRFSRPVYISSSARARAARISRTHTAENKRHTLAPAEPRRGRTLVTAAAVATPIAGTTSLFFAPTAKIKNVGRMRSRRQIYIYINRRCPRGVFVLFGRIDSARCRQGEHHRSISPPIYICKVSHTPPPPS